MSKHAVLGYLQVYFLDIAYPSGCTDDSIVQNTCLCNMKKVIRENMSILYSSSVNDNKYGVESVLNWDTECLFLIIQIESWCSVRCCLTSFSVSLSRGFFALTVPIVIELLEINSRYGAQCGHRVVSSLSWASWTGGTLWMVSMSPIITEHTLINNVLLMAPQTSVDLR